MLRSLREGLRRRASARRNRARGDRCFYCGVTFSGTGKRQRTIDHRLARGRGGSDSLANLVFACRACNQRKADTVEEEFLASTWLADRRREAGAPGDARTSSGPEP